MNELVAAERRSLWVEGLTMYAVTTGLIAVAGLLEPAVIGAGTLSTITTVVLIYVPLAWVLYRKIDLSDIGATLEGTVYSLKVLGAFTLATLVPFYIGNHFFETLILHHRFSFHWPDELGLLIVGEVLAVALPEEFFYRGYLQSRLEAGCAPRFRVLGVEFGWGLVVTSILFAAAHALVHPAWWQIGIVIPALAFGWLRVKTGSILAPVLYHALCNLTMALAQSSY